MAFSKGKHSFIVFTHVDRAHVHNHIIFNSTALDCQHKFRNFIGSSFVLRRVSDKLCESLWACGDRISEGMAREIAEAKRLGIPIREVSAQEIEGGIFIEQQDFITEKLYSPVNFYLWDNDMLEYYDDSNYWRDEMPHEEAWGCMDQTLSLGCG